MQLASGIQPQRKLTEKNRRLQGVFVPLSPGSILSTCLGIGIITRGDHVVYGGRSIFVVCLS